MRLLACAIACVAATGCDGYYARHACGLGYHDCYDCYRLYVPYHPQRDEEERAIAEAEMTPTYVPEVPHLPPRVPPPDPVHAKFDEAAALGALHEVDLAPCAARGAPKGYGHARVTFAPSGAPTVVTIDAPGGFSRDAVACVGERLGSAKAPPFDGSALTMGTSFYVP